MELRSASGPPLGSNTPVRAESVQSSSSAMATRIAGAGDASLAAAAAVVAVSDDGLRWLAFVLLCLFTKNPRHQANVLDG